MLEEKFKIKPLTKLQITIFLDRLTRFKFTEDKYLRVFKEVILSNLIYPKYKKSELELMDYDILTKFAENIFNFSIGTIHTSSCHAELVSASCQHSLLDRSRVSQTGLLASSRSAVPFVNKFGMTNMEMSNDFSINKKLLEYEKNTFKLGKNVEKLLKNKIDYKAAVTLLKGKNSDIPINLRWLKSLSEEGDQIQNRVNLGLKFPLRKLVIVEGITEEILFPKFAKLCGCDFDKTGIYLISAGGKNQVVRLFYHFADILKLPIFVLLDSDALENFDEIKPRLRKHDSAYMLKFGEFEDILPLNLIKRTLNRYFRNYFSIKLKDLRKDMPMTQLLSELFRERGLEFKKAEFASLIGKNISDLKDISEEIKLIIFKISSNKFNQI